MWRNCIEDAYNHISLHDCFISKIQLAKNILTVCFDDGFWMLGNSEYNTCEETVRTDKSQLNFIDFDEEISIFYLFKNHYLLGKRICTTRKKMTFDEVKNKVNNGVWNLEIVEEYHAWRRVLLWGTVRVKKRRRVHEFQITIDCEKTEYCWNNIRTERKW